MPIITAEIKDGAPARLKPFSIANRYEKPKKEHAERVYEDRLRWIDVENR